MKPWRLGQVIIIGLGGFFKIENWEQLSPPRIFFFIFVILKNWQVFSPSKKKKKKKKISPI
jgi:hypothetical protein